MNTQKARCLKTFRPRPSYGWIWLLFMGTIIAALSVAPALAAGVRSSSALLTLIICVPVAITFFVLAVWFPTMRYELSDTELVMRYGPVLTYRIPLAEIRVIRQSTLSPTIWSCIRFPGIALFTAPYADAGNVRMCATAALNRILLIETGDKKYGITPLDEDEFVRTIRTHMGA